MVISWFFSILINNNNINQANNNLNDLYFLLLLINYLKLKEREIKMNRESEVKTFCFNSFRRSFVVQ